MSTSYLSQGVDATEVTAALQVAFDALPWSIAVLDDTGTIVLVNRAWCDFATDNDLQLERCGVGTNYLEVCDRGPDGASEGRSVADAICDLLSGSHTDYIFEYTCHSPRERRWFVVRLRAERVGARQWVTVIHENVTDRRKVEDVRRVAVRRELQALVDARTRELLKANQQLRDADRELRHSENRLHDLTTQLLSAQEDERRRLAREFHDGFGQQIAAVSIQLGNVRQGTELPDALRARLADIQGQVVDLSNDLRRVSHELHPAVLEQLGLEAALKAHCASFGEHEEVAVDFSSQSCPPRLPWSVATCLFRIAQAALRNVVHHSGARRTSVMVMGVAGGVELRVIDDGRGFERGNVSSTGGLGLVSMEERVRPLGGRLTVISSPGVGTELVAFVPLDSGEGDDEA